MFEMNFSRITKLLNCAPVISTKQVQWIAGQIMSSMIFEALRKEPSPQVIAVMNRMLDPLRDCGDLPAFESVVDNLPQFRADASMKGKSEAEKAELLDERLTAEATDECTRRVVGGFDTLPKNPQEAHARVKAMKAAILEKRKEERNRFDEAVEYVRECQQLAIPKALLDDVELPESVLGNVYNTFYRELETMSLARMKLQGNLRLNPWQQSQLASLIASCRMLAEHLGTTLDVVDQSLIKATSDVKAAFAAQKVIQQSASQTDEEAFGAAAGDLTTIDNPPAPKRKRVPKDVVDNAKSRMGLDSEALGAANAVVK